MLPKFTAFDALNNESVYNYGEIYQLEETENYTRLEIGASTDQVQMMLELSACLDAPYFVLYVLVTPRDGMSVSGRYQSPPIESRTALVDFFLDFKEPIETDGRHHVWIGNANNDGLIIYDKHNVIYAYGPIDKYLTVLLNQGYKQEEFDFPYPHGHHFHNENDVAIRELLAYWDWQQFPLVAGEDEEYTDE
ncbi:hypothetical protein [Hymenobacter pini]|uniref:hypothetical protein n=1 Tax=Hymenobacter pini TaxID=2880879 RepID=UPI001CF0E658|nr:hypothetical protein [Hymenobacter pini]MCA8832643.1 hypothetical protein [Hymenobacter pini]